MASWRSKIATTVLDADIDYRRGPGPRHCNPRPVLAAYVNGALCRDCTGCGATAYELCRRRDGTERKIPCPPRLRETRP